MDGSSDAAGRGPGRREGLTWRRPGKRLKGANVKIVTKNFGVADSHKLAVYQQRGGYEALRRALTLQPAALVDEVKKSNLRGRGGAGFPTGMKWSFIPKDAKLVYLVVNADESEPGTCKDRELLAFDPHLLIEGMLIASYALGCKHAYIYIRGEMMREAKIVQGAIDEAYAAGWLGKDHPAVGGGGALQAGHHAPPRRRRLHLRRGDRPAQFARGQARLAAPQAAVPGDQGALRRADGGQQRRDAS